MNIHISPTTLADAVAITRQRSYSSELLPDGKRQRHNSAYPSNTSPSAADVAALTHWRHQQGLSAPTDAPTSSASFAENFETDLCHLENVLQFQAPPAPLTEQQEYSSPESTSDFPHGYSDQRATRNLPTPASTPQFGTPRPGGRRSSTLPLRPSQTNLAATAAANASILGLEREIRAGGPAAGVQVPAAAGVETCLPMRRSTDGGATISAPAPSAVKDHLVSGLVGATVIAIESIWGSSSQCDTPTNAAAIPLHWFVKEVLKRSRTMCSTLQVALYYLHKSRKEVREIVGRAESARQERAKVEQAKRAAVAAYEYADSYPSPPLSPVDSNEDQFDRYLESQSSPLLCGRRMFLAALICASKYLQDRNFSNRAWSKISGLPVKEINDNERVFLGMMKFQLHFPADDFQRWTERLGTLAAQGAVREMATAAAGDNPTRFGLQRTQSEVATVVGMQDLVRPAPSQEAVAPARPPSSVLGRTSSDPSIVGPHGHGLMKLHASPLPQVAPVLPPTPEPIEMRPLRGMPLRGRHLRSSSTAGALRPHVPTCSADTPVQWQAAPSMTMMAH